MTLWSSGPHRRQVPSPCRAEPFRPVWPGPSWPHAAGQLISQRPGLVITPVGERIQVAVEQDVVCLTLSADGMGENVVPGPC